MASSVPCLAKVLHTSVPQSTLLVSASGTLQQPEAFATFLSSGFIFSLHFIKARDYPSPDYLFFSPLSLGNLDQIWPGCFKYSEVLINLLKIGSWA